METQAGQSTKRLGQSRAELDPDELYRDEETQEQRNEKSRAALSIRSEHTLRSENLPFDIDVVSVLLLR